jgi:oxaloacetate decarboxylase beta subunit
MDTVIEIFSQSGFANMTWGNWIMYLVAGVLIFLAIRKEYEPLLLIPIGFGIVLANFPLAEMGSYAHGIIGLIYEGGIKTELLPPIIFLGVGVLTDFRPSVGPTDHLSIGRGGAIGHLRCCFRRRFVIGIYH